MPVGFVTLDKRVIMKSVVLEAWIGRRHKEMSLSRAYTSGLTHPECLGTANNLEKSLKLGLKTLNACLSFPTELPNFKVSCPWRIANSVAIPY